MERLSKNFLWMAGANVVNSAGNVFIFIYLARVLGVEMFGYLAFAQAIVLYLMNFIDLGLSFYGMREIAKDRAKASALVSAIISFRLLIALALFIICVLSVSFFPLTPIVRALLAWYSITFFISACMTEWAYQGIERMGNIFLSFTVSTFFQCALLYVLIKDPNDVLKVPLAYIAAPLPIAILFLRRLRFRFMISVAGLRDMRHHLSSALVIWGISICAQVYNSFDIVILGALKHPEEVGYYSVARRISSGIVLFACFLASAVLPRLSHAYLNDKRQFQAATRKYLLINVFILCTMVVPIALFSRQFITLTVGEAYVPAFVPFTIMMAAVFCIMLNLPFSSGLIAAGFEKDVLKQAAACAVVSVLSNLILIPRYGMVGAALSFLLAETLALVYIQYIYRAKIIVR